MRADPAASRVGQRAAGALSLSQGRDRFVSLAAVHDAIARWSAPLPRSRQPNDADRRAAVACACALSELALEGAADAQWGAAEHGIAEDATAIAERAGLARGHVEPALALLAAAGCVERISGARRERRVWLAADVCGEEPALARVAWAGVRHRLRAVRASLLPAQAVLRSIARQSGPVAAGAAAPVVACTQEGLAAETLLGRTAVVSALRALTDAGLVARTARRGTWTECRLLGPVFDPASPRPAGWSGVVGDQEVPLTRAQEGGAAVVAGRTPLDRSAFVARGSADGLDAAGRGLVGAMDAAQAPAPTTGLSAQLAPPVPTSSAAMVLDVGGVRVPVAPGMTVEPPPDATLSIEVDEAGRRFLRLGPGLRLGPLP